jgi:hypothetical protein
MNVEAHKLAMTRMLPWAAGGAGLAALENKFVGEDTLSKPLQNINVGLGGLTGAALGLPGLTPAERGAILAAYPLKSMALFGTGAIDKFRRSQQDLVNTNLQTARVNQNTARLEADNAGSKKTLAMAFLLPLLMGGGGLAYYAYNHRKRQQENSRFRNVGTRGSLHGKSRVRIDVPATAMPEEFYRSLIHADDNSRAFTRLQQQDLPELENKVAAFKQCVVPVPAVLEFAKWAAANQPSQFGPGFWTDLLTETTGIPSIGRGLREIPQSFQRLAEGDDRNALRYGAAGLGSLAGGLVGLRFGVAPLLGRLMGRARLAAMMRRGPGGGMLRQFPTLGRSIHRWSFGNDMAQRGAVDALGKPIARYATEGQAALRRGLGLSTTGARDRLLNMRYRYDPQRFAWAPPAPGAPRSWFKDTFLRGPKTKPTTLPGQLAGLPRYLTNRSLDTGYRTLQMARRNPNLSLSLAAMPVVGMGALRDQQEARDAKQTLLHSMPDWERHRGPFNMPVSAGLSALMQTVTGQGPTSGLTRQLQGPLADPWAASR